MVGKLRNRDLLVNYRDGVIGSKNCLDNLNAPQGHVLVAIAVYRSFLSPPDNVRLNEASNCPRDAALTGVIDTRPYSIVQIKAPVTK